MTTLHLNAVINTDCIEDVLHHPVQFSSLQCRLYYVISALLGLW